MNKNKIIYWVSTVIIGVLVGLTPLLTWNSAEGKEVFSHLGYPEYFMKMLNVFKILGGIALLVPQIPAKIKEWAYVGFGIDFIAAFVSLVVVDGFKPEAFGLPVFFLILVVSYIYKDKV